MADAVWAAMADGTHLAVQAGTGTGKSLAYLVPALRLAAERHGPVVVSTATIALLPYDAGLRNWAAGHIGQWTPVVGQVAPVVGTRVGYVPGNSAFAAGYLIVLLLSPVAGCVLGAWASRQSQPVESRKALGEAVAHEARRFGIPYEGPGSQEPESITVSLPRPPNWGGYRLYVDAVELWVEGEYRIHDRARFTRPLGFSGTSPSPPWASTRLQP